MLESSNNLISLRDIVRIAFRHKYKASVIFVLTIGIAAATAFLLPKQYTSEAKLFIRLGRTGVALDPTATVGQTVSTSATRERELNSALEILKSRELLNDVVQQVGAEEIAKYHSPQRASNSPSSQEAVLHKAIGILEGALSRDVARNSNVITVSATARSPKLAQHILQTYVEAFRTHHTRLHRTSGSFEFFEAEADKSAKLLATAEAELRDAKNSVGVGSVAGEKKLIDERLTALQRDLINTRTSLAAAKAKIASLVERHPDLDPSALTEAADSSVQDLASMRAELFKLELQERELVAKLAANHPKVIAIKDQVIQARRLFAKQQLIGQRAAAQSLEVKLADLELQRDETKRMLLDLNESEIRITKLTQKVSALRANFEKYQTKSEQARLDGAMATEEISDVNVAQTPTFNPKHISPKKSIILVLGFLAAASGAFAVTMACEYFDNTFQDADQVEAALDLPVVLTVPQSTSQTLAV